MQPNSQTSLGAKARETIARILDHVLEEECSLSATTRDYRGNVTGPNLYSLHRLFDQQRRQLDQWLDRLVERARAAGVPAQADRAAATAASGAGLPARTMIGDLLARHEALAHQLRAEIERLGDTGMVELLIRLIEFHETTAWMLRTLQNGPPAGSDHVA
jgi:starvation-inducible DNA-binding protein